MNEKIFIRPPQIGTGNIQPSPVRPQSQPATTGPSFDSIFQEQLNQSSGLKFSAHALKRLESRQITFDSQDMAKLTDAVNRAEAKGAKESLILTDRAALVVSIKNRTVITAVDEGSLRENVFTNIDSAVIVK